MSMIRVRKGPLTGTWFMKCRCGRRWSNHEWTNVIQAANLHLSDHQEEVKRNSPNLLWLLSEQAYKGPEDEVNRRFIRQSILSSMKTIEGRAKIVGYYSQEELDMLDSLKQIYDNPDAWVTIV